MQNNQEAYIYNSIRDADVTAPGRSVYMALPDAERHAVNRSLFRLMSSGIRNLGPLTALEVYAAIALRMAQEDA